MTTLGNKYRDKISKFTGVATQRLESVTSVPRVEVTPEVAPDGHHVAPEWFDEARLEPAT